MWQDSLTLAEPRKALLGKVTPLGSDGLETAFAPAALPRSLLAFVLRFCGWHQLALSAFAIAVFLLEMAPLELQRRIINDAFSGGNYGAILFLAGLYAAIAVGQGLLKLLMNLYRSWIAEKALRSLRRTVQALSRSVPPADNDDGGAGSIGIESSMMLAEAEPIGAFVGMYLSEPLLQGGVLVSIFGYMAYLQPPMALVAFAVFAPQFVFVPLMQAAINRRVKKRISTLREVAGEIISVAVGKDASVSEERQLRRIERVFGLDMGVFEFKFSMNFLMNALYHFGTASVLAAGGWFVVNGQTEVGTVVAFISGLSRINGPWGDLVDWFRDLTLTEARYDLLAKAVSGPGEMYDLNSGAAFSDSNGV